MTTTNESEPKLRADAQRTRQKLLDAMGRLLVTQGLDVSLPDLAREAGVATATVYRHFDDVAELREEFYRRIVDSILAAVTMKSEHYQGLELFEQVCLSWVESLSSWARAATFIRSAEGYLERVKQGDLLVSRLDAVLRPVIADLIRMGVIPEQDVDYAVLIWVTLFDERVFVDLEASLGWDVGKRARTLSSTVLAALGRLP